LVVGMDHDPDLHDQANGGREEEWAGISRAMASDPARSNGPYDTRSHKDSGKEAELIMCNGEITIHP